MTDLAQENEMLCAYIEATTKNASRTACVCGAAKIGDCGGLHNCTTEFDAFVRPVATQLIKDKNE